jgi:glucokinase
VQEADKVPARDISDGRSHRGRTLGVDVGGTKVLGVALDSSGVVVCQARAATPLSHHQLQGNGLQGNGLQGNGVESRAEEPSGQAEPASPPGTNRVVAAISEVVGQLVAGTGSEPGDGHGLSLGVGVPGLVDDDGTMHFAPNLPAGAGVDFKASLTAATGVTNIVIDNDATCAAVGEWLLGAAAGASDALMITLGTGIGAGIIAGGAVLRGTNGYAGEAGHMVVDPSGPLCSCGRRGCWERYASGSGLARLAREAATAGRLGAVMALARGDAESVRGEHVTEAAAAGDPGALEVMAELGWWIALGLANLTALLDPAVVVIGGGLVGAGELLLEPTRSAYAEILYAGGQRPPVSIVPAGLGELAGAVGAALMARADSRTGVIPTFE